jgi:hypothetical protein
MAAVRGFVAFGLTWALSTGCAIAPPPVPIHDEPSLLVDVAYDPHAGSDHSHPAAISPDQIAVVLRGLQLQARDVTGTGGFLSDRRLAPAFSERDVRVLAPLLATGLSKASPRDLVRFHLVQPDSNGSPLVTSGGLFMHLQHLYIILANGKTSPSSVQYETTYEPNSRLDPLLPIARFKFKAEFVPAEWRIATQEAKRTDGWSGYLDESKVVVVDMRRLSADAPTR